MGDLDSLLQDFSYLKSLEHKNQTPRKVSKKLLLPDPSVHHVVRKIFESTNECVFERIFHRPIGHRCLQDFLFDEANAEKYPAGKMCIEFTNKLKDLYAEQPDEAYKSALAMKETFMENAVLKENNVWTDAALFEELESKLRRLETKAKNAAADDSKTARSMNIKEIFKTFEQGAKDFLSGEPWAAFIESKYFIRYCQWKHLELNMKISEADFDVHRILGRGGFGEVFGCRKHDTGQMFAMKKLDKRRLKLKHQETSAVHERNVLAEMHSKFVTNLKYAFHDADTLYLILDLMEGGDLSWHLKKKPQHRFTEDEAKFYSAEIIMGLAHIHDRKLIYRDLKPANVLLDGLGHARISDLGLARDTSKNLPTSECGTHGYMAPEVIIAEQTYGQGADWWSLGCVIYQFLVGHSPFRGSGGKKLTKEEVDRRTLEMDVSYPSYMSTEAKDLIGQLLERDPKTRLGCRGKGASEIRAHAWFSDIDWQALVDHKISPKIQPFTGQVNAKDVYDIDRFDQHDTRRVVITPEDNRKYYRHFDHIMSHQWQEEVLAVYKLVSDHCNAIEAKRESRITRGAARDERKDMEGILMEGYLLKLGGMFSNSWQSRYVHLFGDRIEWRNDQLQSPKHSILYSEITECEQTLHKNLTVLRIVTGTKPYLFRTMHACDSPIWTEILTRAWGDARQIEVPVLGLEHQDSKHSGVHEITDFEPADEEEARKKQEVLEE